MSCFPPTTLYCPALTQFRSLIAYGICPSCACAVGYQDLPLGTSFAQVDGSSIVAGRTAVAGTDIADSRTSLFHVTPGSIIRTQSQYNDSYSSQFFSKPRSPVGLLSLESPRMRVSSNWPQPKPCC